MSLPVAQAPPSTALVVTSANVLTASERREFAKSLSGSTFLPQHFRSNESNILYAVELGQSFGLEPVSIMKNIHVFDDGQGRVQAALSADLMVSLARRAGHLVHVRSTATKAIATLVRGELLMMDLDRMKALSDTGLPLKDLYTFEESWSEDDALAAGLLNKQNWKKYPRAMRQARAKAAVVRAGASEALIQMSDFSQQHGGLVINGQRIMPETTHTADELGDERSYETDTPEVTANQQKTTRSQPVVMNSTPPASERPSVTLVAPASTEIPKETNQQVVDLVKEASATAIAQLANGIVSGDHSPAEMRKRLVAIHAALKHTGRLELKVEAPEGVMPLGKFVSSLATKIK